MYMQCIIRLVVKKFIGTQQEKINLKHQKLVFITQSTKYKKNVDTEVSLLRLRSIFVLCLNKNYTLFIFATPLLVVQQLI